MKEKETAMNMSIPKISKTIFVLFLLPLFIIPSGAIEKNTRKEDITLEHVFGPEARKAMSMPYFRWMADSTAVLGNPNPAPGTPAFEIFNPSTQKRTPAFDSSKALQHLKTLLKDKTPERLPRPQTWHRGGKRILFNFGAGLFVLRLPETQFSRVPHSTPGELGATFSPDGQKLAYARNNNVYVYDIPSNTEKALTTKGTETHLFGTISPLYREDVFLMREAVFRWSPDSRHLAFLESDVSHIPVLYYKDITPYFPRQIKQRYPVAGSPIARVNIHIAEVPGPPDSSIMVRLPQQARGEQDFYIVNLDWLTDSRRLAVQTLDRLQERLDLYFTQRNNGETRHILSETDPAWVNVSDDIYFLEDKKHFIWGSERSDYKHLYLYTLEGKLVNPITRGKWAVRGPFQTAFWFGRSVVSIPKKGNWIYFTGQEKSYRERHLYRIRLDGSGMRRITSEDGFHSVAFSPDGKYYVDWFSRASVPPRLSLHRKNGKKIMEIANPSADFSKRFHVQTPELITVPADDGFRMPAKLWKPRDFDPSKKYPVIIYHYGGPSAPLGIDRFHRFTYYNQVLLNNGYLVFNVDNRSATAIGKAYERVILNQMVGPNELKDLLAAVKWLKGLDYVDPERVGMWGWSYGGCFTLMAMTESKEFKAGIAGAAASDHRFHSPKWTEFSMKLPQQNKEAYDRVSNLTHAKDLHGRLLLVHGGYDDNVRPQNLWAMVDALVAAGKQFDMMVYPMRKHGVSDPAGRIHLYKKMLEFWKLYL